MDLVRDIVTIYRNYGFMTQVLAASIRHPLHVVEAAKAAADVVTLPYKVFEELFRTRAAEGQYGPSSDIRKCTSQG